MDLSGFGGFPISQQLASTNYNNQERFTNSQPVRTGDQMTTLNPTSISNESGFLQNERIQSTSSGSNQPVEFDKTINQSFIPFPWDPRKFSLHKSLINTETEEPTDAMDFKGRAASSNCPSSGSASLPTGLRVIPTSDIIKEYPAVFRLTQTSHVNKKVVYKEKNIMK
ncbi:unnamed protein product [Mytilus edulis]|uniref:Uncharacterized protein n=1 Tax=Mytilus edulis TaxID=6550 RepID=A0A8S3SGS3_MYTED|nr:unnamed protein product [Mytilus edulis]